MNQEKIGKFIAKLRKDKNITQEELANKLGVNSRSVSRWENGKCMPDLSLLLPLSNELGTSINEMLAGEKIDEMTKENSDKIINNSLENYIKIEKQKLLKKVLIIIIIIIISIPILILSYNQSRKDKWGDSVGTSWSSLYTRYYSDKFFTALQNNNYDELEKILGPFNSCYNHESKEDYINKVKELQKAGVKFLDHEYHSTWLSGKDWIVGYSIKIKYQDIPIDMYGNIDILVATKVNNGKVTSVFPMRDYKTWYFNETIWSEIIAALSYCSYKLE
jgi:transcriptional regulator with XRE-family HTH domain